MSMFILQIIFVFVYLIKRLKSLKYFMLNFENKNLNNNQNKRKINIINNTGYKNINNKNNSKKKIFSKTKENHSII